MQRDYTLDVSEIFFSLQGEGPYLGRPFVFLRLAGCIEPYCPFCDTKYSWKSKKVYKLDQLIEVIWSFDLKNIVITGGEPFLQWNLGLSYLVDILYNESFFIQYETSGKVEIPDNPKGVVVLSPKFLNNSWQIVDTNIVKCDFIKFLYWQGCEDLILNFVEKFSIPKEKVYIMPLGKTKESQLNLMPHVFKFCIKHGFNMSPRLHVLCFDDRKGI